MIWQAQWRLTIGWMPIDKQGPSNYWAHTPFRKTEFTAGTAGRAEETRLHPLSLSEYCTARGRCVSGNSSKGIRIQSSLRVLSNQRTAKTDTVWPTSRAPDLFRNSECSDSHRIYGGTMSFKCTAASICAYLDHTISTRARYLREAKILYRVFLALSPSMLTPRLDLTRDREFSKKIFRHPLQPFRPQCPVPPVQSDRGWNEDCL